MFLFKWIAVLEISLHNLKNGIHDIFIHEQSGVYLIINNLLLKKIG